ncbi:hypothetical protein TYRP_006359 [Tyrophagus putrescentiae]|nr:hypothetical protein TYRP_006359 [Tyrophagus putrescentiae]
MAMLFFSLTTVFIITVDAIAPGIGIGLPNIPSIPTIPIIVKNNTVNLIPAINGFNNTPTNSSSSNNSSSSPIKTLQQIVNVPAASHASTAIEEAIAAAAASTQIDPNSVLNDFESILEERGGVGRGRGRGRGGGGGSGGQAREPLFDLNLYQDSIYLYNINMNEAEQAALTARLNDRYDRLPLGEEEPDHVEEVAYLAFIFSRFPDRFQAAFGLHPNEARMGALNHPFNNLRTAWFYYLGHPEEVDRPARAPQPVPPPPPPPAPDQLVPLWAEFSPLFSAENTPAGTGLAAARPVLPALHYGPMSLIFFSYVDPYPVHPNRFRRLFGQMSAFTMRRAEIVRAVFCTMVVEPYLLWRATNLLHLNMEQAIRLGEVQALAAPIPMNLPQPPPALVYPAPAPDPDPAPPSPQAAVGGGGGGAVEEELMNFLWDDLAPEVQADLLEAGHPEGAEVYIRVGPLPPPSPSSSPPAQGQQGQQAAAGGGEEQQEGDHSDTSPPHKRERREL